MNDDERNNQVITEWNSKRILDITEIERPKILKLLAMAVQKERKRMQDLVSPQIKELFSCSICKKEDDTGNFEKPQRFCPYCLSQEVKKGIKNERAEIIKELEKNFSPIKDVHRSWTDGLKEAISIIKARK